MKRHKWIVVDTTTVRNIQERDDLIFVSNSTEVAYLNMHVGSRYRAYFVKLRNNDCDEVYGEVYGMQEQVPYLNETLYKLELREVQYE